MGQNFNTNPNNQPNQISSIGNEGRRTAHQHLHDLNEVIDVVDLSPNRPSHDLRDLSSSSDRVFAQMLIDQIYGNPRYANVVENQVERTRNSIGNSNFNRNRRDQMRERQEYNLRSQLMRRGEIGGLNNQNLLNLIPSSRGNSFLESMPQGNGRESLLGGEMAALMEGEIGGNDRNGDSNTNTRNGNTRTMNTNYNSNIRNGGHHFSRNANMNTNQLYMVSVPIGMRSQIQVKPRIDSMSDQMSLMSQQLRTFSISPIREGEQNQRDHLQQEQIQPGHQQVQIQSSQIQSSRPIPATQNLSVQVGLGLIPRGSTGSRNGKTELLPLPDGNHFPSSGLTNRMPGILAGNGASRSQMGMVGALNGGGDTDRENNVMDTIPGTNLIMTSSQQYLDRLGPLSDGLNLMSSIVSNTVNSHGDQIQIQSRRIRRGMSSSEERGVRRRSRDESDDQQIPEERQSDRGEIAFDQISHSSSLGQIGQIEVPSVQTMEQMQHKSSARKLAHQKKEQVEEGKEESKHEENKYPESAESNNHLVDNLEQKQRKAHNQKVKKGNLAMIKDRIMDFRRNFLAFHAEEKLLVKNLVIYELMRSTRKSYTIQSSCQIRIEQNSNMKANLPESLGLNLQTLSTSPTNPSDPSTFHSNPSNLQQLRNLRISDPGNPFELAVDNGVDREDKFIGSDSSFKLPESPANPVRNLAFEDIGENLMNLPKADWIRIFSLGTLVLDETTIEKVAQTGGRNEGKRNGGEGATGNDLNRGNVDNQNGRSSNDHYAAMIRNRHDSMLAIRNMNGDHQQRIMPVPNHRGVIFASGPLRMTNREYGNGSNGNGSNREHNPIYDSGDEGVQGRPNQNPIQNPTRNPTKYRVKKKHRPNKPLHNKQVQKQNNPFRQGKDQLHTHNDDGDRSESDRSTRRESLSSAFLPLGVLFSNDEDTKRKFEYLWSIVMRKMKGRKHRNLPAW